MIEEVKYK